MTTLEMLWGVRQPEPTCHIERVRHHIEAERYRLRRVAVLTVLLWGAFTVALYKDLLVILTVASILGTWIAWVANQWQRIKKLEWDVARLKEDVEPFRRMPAQLIEVIAGVKALTEGQALLRSELGELARSVHDHHEREARSA